MTISMYCLYVGVDYTYIDINALARAIKSFLASQVWFQAVAGARTYVCMYVCIYLSIYLSIYLCMCECKYGCGWCII